MDKFIAVVSNPIVWWAITLVAGLIVKVKLTSYLKLLSLLIDAIEIFDDEIQDICSDNARQTLVGIKQRIAVKVKGAEKKTLNNILDNKGYRHDKVLRNLYR
jgi:hypothetical protein